MDRMHGKNNVVLCKCYTDVTGFVLLNHYKNVRAYPRLRRLFSSYIKCLHFIQHESLEADSIACVLLFKVGHSMRPVYSGSVLYGSFSSVASLVN